MTGISRPNLRLQGLPISIMLLVVLLGLSTPPTACSPHTPNINPLPRPAHPICSAASSFAACTILAQPKHCTTSKGQ
jgi:hypothetical protein